MMIRKKIISFCLVFGSLILLASVSRGETNLLSLKKGAKGNRYWAVLHFDDSAPWVGVAQSKGTQISLYFTGRSDKWDNQELYLDPSDDIRIRVTQLRRNPDYFKADIFFDGEMPLAVLKHDRDIVIGLNDFRLLEGKMIGTGESVTPPGRLVKVTPRVNRDKITTSFEFDGGYDWVGYVRPSSEEVALLIRGARLFTNDNDFYFEEGPLQTVSLQQSVDDRNRFKAEMFFAPTSSFSIVKGTENLIVQTPNTATDTGAYATASSGVPDRMQDTELQESGVQTDLLSYDTGSRQETPVSETMDTGTTVREQVVQDIEEAGREPVEETESPIPWNTIVGFSFRDTPLNDALRLIATSNGLNMVISEGVEGSVTMNLEDITLRQALDLVVHTHDCEYIVDGKIITVKPVGLAIAGGRFTKIYRLRYADANNVKKILSTMVSSDSLVQVFHPEFLEFTVAGKARQVARSVAVQGIRRSSILIVTERPEKIKEIDIVIDELDRPPIQIRIESKLVEMSPSINDKLGIDWDKTLSAQIFGSQQVGDEYIDYSAINLNPAEHGKWQMASLSSGQYQVVLDFLRQKTDSKLVSNPSLTTMDNEEASISVGTTVPIPQIQRGLGGSGDMVTFDYKEVNIQLNVTPHVGRDGNITMYVNPVIEEITEWTEYMGQRAPITAKRSVNSIVTVRGGETVVIGGLIKNKRIMTTKKVWLLGSIPLIGKFFEHRQTEEVQTNLMIFITPKVVELS